MALNKQRGNILKCFLCGRTEKEIKWLDTDIPDWKAGWLYAPNNRDYCPLCIRDRFDEIEKIEGGNETQKN